MELTVTYCSCRWEYCAQPKVVVKIESEEEMLVLQVSLLNMCYVNILALCKIAVS
jgi:peptidyl-tRNA hydrolase